MKRPRRFFKSWLGRDIKVYLALKRAMGRKYLGEESTLRYLDRFVAQRFPFAKDLSVSILEAWIAASRLQPYSRATQLVRVRQFCLYRQRTSPNAFVPDRHQHRTLWPHHVPRRLPIILSKNDVRRLLRAALALPERPGSRRRRETFFTILLVLYRAGLRRSEAARLRIGDVDVDAGTLLVRETKFFKTRLVPVAADVLKHLRRYVKTMRPSGTSATAEQPLFQISGRGCSATAITHTGANLLRACGLKPESGPGGARVHDLRATFAVHRIASWYAEGEDVQSKLPALATYMGHKNIISTQHYVAVTGELLKHAAGRFEMACAPREG